MKNLIILIDDDLITNIVNKKFLSSKYPEVKIKEFNSAGKALEYLKKDNKIQKFYIIIFLDLNMPEISGWDFIEILDNEFPQTSYRLILLTSSIDEKDLIKSKNFDTVDAFISKPLSVSKLNEINFSLNR